MIYGYVYNVVTVKMFHPYPGPQNTSLLLNFRTPNKGLGVSAGRMPEECELLPFPTASSSSSNASDYFPTHNQHRRLLSERAPKGKNGGKDDSWGQRLKRKSSAL